MTTSENRQWPTDRVALETLQQELAALEPPPWSAAARAMGGCFVCFRRGGSGSGSPDDPGWAAAVVMHGHRISDETVVSGRSGAPYAPGLLAAREGRLLDLAVRSLTKRPDVLLVNATGWDHPRRAGLAVQIGWALDIPTVGVTHRPLIGEGSEPGSDAGAHTPLRTGDEQVGWWLRTRKDARPVAVSPGWRTDLDTVLTLVISSIERVRTPEPIRQARRLARTARGQEKRS